MRNIFRRRKVRRCNHCSSRGRIFAGYKYTKCPECNGRGYIVLNRKRVYS